MTHYTYPITIEKDGKQYYAYSDDLPGVYGLGPTIEKAKTSILEAIRLYILECRKKVNEFPLRGRLAKRPVEKSRLTRS
ncbi:MAG TPA: type II toxin-antitoxin system HicB family antitoxin [Candidatus Acidoferrum sp.]|nr:type II toxin-antitoxin system HicB family antitoxin [Candidatus Acidoferrum sp.]